MKVNVGGVWKSNGVTQHVRVAGVWKQTSYGYVKVSGTWRRFYRNPRLIYEGTVTVGTMFWYLSNYYGYNEGNAEFSVPTMGSRSPTVAKPGMRVSLIQHEDTTNSGTGWGPHLQGSIGIGGNRVGTYTLETLRWGNQYSVQVLDAAGAYNSATDSTVWHFRFASQLPLTGTHVIWF